MVPEMCAPRKGDQGGSSLKHNEMCNICIVRSCASPRPEGWRCAQSAKRATALSSDAIEDGNLHVEDSNAPLRFTDQGSAHLARWYNAISPKRWIGQKILMEKMSISTCCILENGTSSREEQLSYPVAQSRLAKVLSTFLELDN